MESDDDKDHFDYKEIVKKESKKSKKRKSKKADNEKEDDFKIDFNDQRFSAIFKKAEFNVDPSNPNFKKTISKANHLSAITSVYTPTLRANNIDFSDVEKGKN